MSASKQAPISCTFLNPKTKLIEEVMVQPGTGLGAQLSALRDACQAYARAVSAPYFAMPVPVSVVHGERWLVFAMDGAPAWRAALVKDWPNRASAEMWMQHTAGGLRG